MWYETPIFFAVWVAWFVFGKGYDSFKSLNFDWYGLQEGNKLWRTKDGLFDVKKNTIAAGIFLAISCLIGILSHSWGAGAALLIAGGPGLTIQGYLNARKRKKNRAKQIEILRTLRSDPNAVPDVGSSPIGLGGHTMITINGRSFMLPFQFLSVPTQADPQETLDAVWAEIVRYARGVPEEQWFKY